MATQHARQFKLASYRAAARAYVSVFINATAPFSIVKSVIYHGALRGCTPPYRRGSTPEADCGMREHASASRGPRRDSRIVPCPPAFCATCSRPTTAAMRVLTSTLSKRLPKATRPRYGGLISTPHSCWAGKAGRTVMRFPRGVNHSCSRCRGFILWSKGMCCPGAQQVARSNQPAGGCVPAARRQGDPILGDHSPKNANPAVRTLLGLTRKIARERAATR